MLQNIERSGYHLTLSYFWVQMVTYHLAVEAKQKQATATDPPLFGAFGQKPGGSHPVNAEDEEYSLPALQLLKESDFASAAPAMTFAEFLLRPHCQPLRNALLYSK